MKQLIAFSKKEFVELYRSGKLLILGILFTVLGIMNPAMAKITPFLFESLSDELEEQGMIIKEVSVTAYTSWQQFYKNVPLIGLIVLVVMFSGMMAGEYQKGTLINILTKGMDRWKIVAAKEITAIYVWTACYWLSYGITYAYSQYFWQNGDVDNLFTGALCVYVVGLMLIGIIMAGSVMSSSMSGSLLFTGGIFAVCYIIGVIPKATKYTPTKLLSSMALINDTAKLDEFIPALIISGIVFIAGTVMAIALFNKKKI